MNEREQKQSSEAWFKFFRSLPGFPEERADELHRHFLKGMESVLEPQNRARKERAKVAAAKEGNAA